MKNFRLKQILKPLLLFLGIGLMTIPTSCDGGKAEQWEYRTYIVNGQTQSDEYEEYLSKKAIPDNEEMNKLGKEGWELVSSYELLETTYPNFGNKQYVTGIQPNTRTGAVAFVFKRLRQKGAEADSDSVRYDIWAIDPLAVANKKAGTELIEKKAKEPGYKKTASGIVYKVLEQGSGANFTESDVITLKRKCTSIDGKVYFDTGDKPIERCIDDVFSGFGEMLKLMKPGMKVEAIIPTGASDNTGFNLNETVIYEIETISSKHKEEKKQ